MAAERVAGELDFAAERPLDHIFGPAHAIHIHLRLERPVLRVGMPVRVDELELGLALGGAFEMEIEIELLNGDHAETREFFLGHEGVLSRSDGS
jgi:hypothetical protein